MLEEYKEVLESLGLRHINLVNTPEKPKHEFLPYYWWRRFGTHKNIKGKSLDRAKNGDFEPSPYWDQVNFEYFWLAEEISNLRKKLGFKDKIQEREIVQSYNRRIKKLTQDALLDEEARIKDLYSCLVRDNKVDKKTVENYIQNYARGTIEECILEFPIWLKKEITNKYFKNFIDEKLDLAG